MPCDPLVYARMERLRERYGSWASVAAAFGVTPPFISNIRSGVSTPSPAILEELELRREVVRTVRITEVPG